MKAQIEGNKILFVGRGMELKKWTNMIKARKQIMENEIRNKNSNLPKQVFFLLRYT